MVAKSVIVESFRCILYEVLTCENLTALVGPNGSGKSAFLKAIDLFYSTSPKLSPEDFYNEDTTKSIQITMTYCDLDEAEKKQFGFKKVAQGYLGRFTRYLYIPAVREAASDASEGRGSPITQVMDLVVRSLVQNRADFKQFRENADHRYSEIFSPGNLTELGGLQDNLAKTLR